MATEPRQWLFHVHGQSMGEPAASHQAMISNPRAPREMNESAGGGGRDRVECGSVEQRHGVVPRG